MGEFTKEKVRQIARELDLSVATKPESQEICFIPDDDYPKFLQKYLPEAAKPGPILDKRGKIIGEHHGILFYTIGQRKRLGISAKEPSYVIAIGKESNTIVIGKKEEVYGNELIANNVNFIDIEKLKAPMRVKAKIRYLHQISPATIIPLNKDKVKVKFEQLQWAITPGQAIVFYNEDAVIGGGTIFKTERNKEWKIEQKICQ